MVKKEKPVFLRTWPQTNLIAPGIHRCEPERMVASSQATLTTEKAK